MFPSPLRGAQHGKHEERPTVKLPVLAADITDAGAFQFQLAAARQELRTAYVLIYLAKEVFCNSVSQVSHSQTASGSGGIFFHEKAESLGHWDRQSRTLSHSCSYNL